LGGARSADIGMTGSAIAALRIWAKRKPDAVAVEGGGRVLGYAELAAAVDEAAMSLAGAAPRRCAVLMDNGPGWVAVDLAARLCGAVIVPIPGFFSTTQFCHAVVDAGVELVLLDRAAAVAPALGELAAWRRGRLGERPPLDEVEIWEIPWPVGHVAAPIPGQARKLTFTSGTTGAPKGVCLADAALDRVAGSLLEAVEGDETDRHLSLLPFAMLLENLAGIDVALMAGARIVAPPLREVGIGGSSSLDLAAMLEALERYRPTSIVTVPQILLALTEAARHGFWRPRTLRHVAVGGAPLPRGAIEAARQQGLPAFEGYGLSECGSVVTLNTAAATHAGSVGRPLPHVKLGFAPDGEILVRGALFAGYLGERAPALVDGFWPTGDLGRLDADGFLHLTGRKTNMFVTSFGRNVAPEWVECELAAEAGIGQAAVFGEARPWNIAILVPRRMDGDWRARLAAGVASANARLPDYARVRRWLPADEAFLPTNGLTTANGRLRRAQIEARYRFRIERLFAEETLDVL
jgi:long-chain acyl-CoA synthetase